MANNQRTEIKIPEAHIDVNDLTLTLVSRFGKITVDLLYKFAPIVPEYRIKQQLKYMYWSHTIRQDENREYVMAIDYVEPATLAERELQNDVIEAGYVLALYVQSEEVKRYHVSASKYPTQIYFVKKVSPTKDLDFDITVFNVSNMDYLSKKLKAYWKERLPEPEDPTEKAVDETQHIAVLPWDRAENVLLLAYKTGFKLFAFVDPKTHDVTIDLASRWYEQYKKEHEI